RSSMGELTASRDAMASLAGDTGGKTIFNTNALSTAVSSAIKETSVYYVIAWRPENDQQRNTKSRRLEVSVAGRPQLVVRFRRGLGETVPAAEAKRAKEQTTPPTVKTAADELREVLRAPMPAAKLPVSIALNFMDTAQSGSTVTTSIKVGTSSLGLDSVDGAPAVSLDIAGYVLNDQGRSVSSFSKRFTIRLNQAADKLRPPENVFYNDAAPVKPGLYQVRVAARDVKSGTIGSSFQWIEI